MNIDYFIKSVIYIVLFIFFPIVFYFAGRKIANFTKYQGRIKVYLILTISSIISLIYFYFYVFLLNVFDFNIEYLNYTSLIFIPMSYILLILFSKLFLLAKHKKQIGR